MATRYSTLFVLLALGCAARTESADHREGQALSESENEASDCESHYQVLDCTTAEGEEGNQYCDIGDEGFVLTECVPNQSTTGTPLVLSFDERPVTFTVASGQFDLFGIGKPVHSAWVGADTPWLVLDSDQSGRIEDGSELFGSMSRLSDGRRASQGFEALAELDEDGDGFVTPRDARFYELRLWRDRDQDRNSTPDELSSLAEAGVVALEVGFSEQARCTPAGCERERARFFFQDGDTVRVGALVDVHLNGSY